MNTDYETLGTHVYIWIGTTDKDEEEYYKYFELDYTYDIDDTRYKICNFCLDIGERWYDEDFIFSPSPLKEEVNMMKILEDSIVLDKENVIKKCREFDINKANAIFGYVTPDDYYENGCLHIKKPYKDNYNGLKYIGKFIHN